MKFFLNKLEDPERPLLGPNVKWLKLWGLWLPEHKIKRRIYMTIHILMFIFGLTEYIDLFVIIINKSNWKDILDNMRYTMVATVSMSKITSFLVYQERWKSIITYVSIEDKKRRKTQDKRSQLLIQQYTQYCRKMTYSYYFLIYFTITTTLIIAATQYVLLSIDEKNTNASDRSKYDIQILNSWLPIDRHTLLGHSLTVSYQILAYFYAGCWISSFDANALGILIFFKGEIELLRRHSKYMFGTEQSNKTEREAKIELCECHRRHNDLIKYSRLFDSCLSPIMLLYVVVCSVMLCATTYQITFETSALQRFITAEYLIFGVSQLFMYCWHSNEVYFVSKDLSLGPYESIWWARDISEQNDIKILTEQFKKSIVFSAGPFSEITVATFISILKGAYSYYTLLSQSQEN